MIDGNAQLNDDDYLGTVDTANMDADGHIPVSTSLQKEISALKEAISKDSKLN